MTNFIKRSITIGAGIGIIQEILIQYRHICVWERGFDSFKELHVCTEQTKIVHWDIEGDINYIFDLTEYSDNISLELKVVDLSGVPNGAYTWKSVRHYVNTVLNRIKNLAERMQVDKNRQHTALSILEK